MTAPGTAAGAYGVVRCPHCGGTVRVAIEAEAAAPYRAFVAEAASEACAFDPKERCPWRWGNEPAIWCRSCTARALLRREVGE
jgi:hypothetical protein